jgi:Phosphotransferase enzyme family
MSTKGKSSCGNAKTRLRPPEDALETHAPTECQSEASIPPQPERVLFRPSVVRVNEFTMEKCGKPVAVLREVEAIKFINRHTSIPTPEIVDDAGTSGGAKAYFRMKHVPGESLRIAWSSMNSTQQSAVVAELRGYITQLRSLTQQNPGWIGSCSRGPTQDQRINNGVPFGPLTNERAFNDLLLQPLEPYASPNLLQSYRSSLLENHKIVFTHGDLSGDNILVDAEQGRVTAILDWATAGWMPEYWEYRKARYGSNHEQWWIGVVHGIMRRYDREWKVDAELECF